MTTTPFGDAPQLGNEVLEDEEELKDPNVIKPLVEKPKEEEKEKTIGETLPKWRTDASVMKKAGALTKLWHTTFHGDFHPSHLTGLEINGKPYLDHTKSELKELSTRDFAKMKLDRAKDDVISEWNILNENIKEKNWGRLITRPIYGATRAVANFTPATRDIANTMYLGVPTAATGTLNFIGRNTIGTAFPGIIEPMENLEQSINDAFYGGAGEGITPLQGEMTKEERQGDASRTEFVSAVASSGLWLRTLKALQQFKATRGLASLFDPRTAKTKWGVARKTLGFSFIEEATVAMSTDPRITGSLVSVASEKWDPAMQAGITENQAYVRKAGIDVPFGMFVSTAAEIGTALKADGLVREFLRGLKNSVPQAVDNATSGYRRAQVGKSYSRKRTGTTDFLEEEGVIAKDADGKYRTGDAVRPATADEQEAALINKYIPADNSKPEVTTVVETIDDNTTVEGSAEIQQRIDAGENSVEVVADVTGREEIAAAPDAKFGLSTAPTSSLSGSKYYELLESIDKPTLRAMANSDDDFALEVLSQLGKRPNELNRLDLIEAFKRLEETKGISVLPNRLSGQQVASLAELFTDPVRFQYKQGVDEFGVQTGSSLAGVQKYNTDLENAVDVWRDPADGKTYIVNGHNRRALAEKLGIPSLRVNYIVAKTADEAKVKGALSNIASGSGTGIDAAKFFKARGITSPDQLENLGIPLASGKAVEGLALSKLPDNIFQDFVDGKLTRSKAMALGGSEMDEAGMQQAYKMLQTRDMSDGTFSQVIEQAKLSPTIEGDQVDLFGNTETLNLMVEKAKLADRIEKDLKSDKILFKKVLDNKKKLAAKGTKVGEGTTQIVSDTGLAVEQFKAQKYTETRLSQLLNEGAIELQQGGKIGPIKSRIQQQFVESLGDAELQKAIEIPPAPEPPAPTKKEILKDIAVKTLEKGEARAPSTPIPPIPEVEDINLKEAFSNAGKNENPEYQKLLDTETRLREEQVRINESVEADKLTKERTDTGYYEKTYEEKKKAGVLDAFREDVKLNEGFQEVERNTRSMFGIESTKVSDEKLIEIGRMTNSRLDFELRKFGKKKLTEKKIQNRLKKLTDFESKQERFYEINKDMDREFQLSQDKDTRLMSAEERAALDAEYDEARGIVDEREKLRLDKAEQELKDHNVYQALQREKWKREIVNFEVENKRIFEGATGKAFNRLVAAMDRTLGHEWKGGLETAGDLLNVLDVARRSSEVAVIKALEDFEKVTTSKSGRRLNVDEQFPFIKPFLSKDPEYRAKLKEQRLAKKKKLQSSVTGIDYTNGNYDEMYYRRNLQNIEDRKTITAADSLAEYGVRISDELNGRIFQSKVLTNELLAAMKDALHISGIPLNNLKVFDDINLLDKFGAEELARTTAEWDPGRATFISRNPDDPLARTAAGETGGLYVPIDYSEKVQQSIYLALYPALNQRLGGLLSHAPKGGRPFSWTLYHEAFHGVQDLIKLMNLDADSLDSTESIKEMVGIIKKYGGNYQPTMSNKEIQAEAFGIWATNRKIKLTKGGLVKTSFERIKKFIQSLRIKYDLMRKKELGYTDIFEIAAKGNIAKAAAIEGLSDHQLFFMTSKLNDWSHHHAPQLTMRVFEYLEAKKADYDNLIFGANNQFTKEGC